MSLSRSLTQLTFPLSTLSGLCIAALSLTQTKLRSPCGPFDAPNQQDTWVFLSLVTLLRLLRLQLLVPPDATADNTASGDALPTAATPAFQIDAEVTKLELLAPGMAIPDRPPNALPVFPAETDTVLARALAALELSMREVPDSAVTAVTRAIGLGRASHTTYADLAGVDLLAKELHRLVTMPLKRPDFFTTYGLDPPRGVLMYGPPGSGKTRLACAAAAEAEASMMVRHSGCLPASADRLLHRCIAGSRVVPRTSGWPNRQHAPEMQPLLGWLENVRGQRTAHVRDLCDARRLVSTAAY